MSRNFELSVGEFYHIYNHGNGDRNVFLNDSDRWRFIKLLYLANSTKQNHFDDISFGQEFDINRDELVTFIGAYCLLDNHYHFLVKEKGEGGISKFIQKLSTGYTMYFNIKYHKRGSLFEGRFRAKHLDDDSYLKYIFSYIHLNPVKMIDKNWKENGLKNLPKTQKFLEEYKFSSYPDYLYDNRLIGKILNKEAFPMYFSDKKEIKEEMFDWLNYELPQG